MPTQPTSTIYQWCTNLLNRSEPTDNDKANGFVSGRVVPPLTFNDLIGRMSDWVQFFSESMLQGLESNTLIIVPGVLNWFPVVSDPGNVSVASPLGGVTVTEDGSGNRSAYAGFGPVPVGGTISAVTLSVTGLNTSAGTATASVLISDIDTNTGVYTANVTTTGSLVLPLTSGTAPTKGPIFIQITLETGSGNLDDITVSDLSFTIN